MAAPGGVLNQSVLVPQRPDEVMNRLVAATAGAPGYSVSTTGPTSLVLVRRYWPTWVIVVAVLGTLVFLIGLLALLIRETETLTISLGASPEGTRVDVSGTASSELASRVRSVLSSLEQTPAAEVAQHDQRNLAPSDEKLCPQCAETVKAGANVCRFCGHRFVPTEEVAE